ncbi:MAG: hypothetical protein ACO3VI_12640 [Ilumatobacteraceae bacterium]
MPLLDARDESDALEQLHDLGCTDGLPVVIPTPERVDRLVLATGFDSDVVLGEMGPLGGAVTVEKVAANAVMAGCTPDDMPFVVAAVQAVLQPDFDLSEVQSTTHSIAPLLIVNGPLAPIIGIASGFGALGPGHRANASIGRALRLCMINIGGARPGTSDMALLGHPGKFTMCLAEAEETSPFPPLATEVGFGPGDDVITVVGVEAPHSVMFVNDADDPDSPERLLRVIAGVITNSGSNNLYLRTGSVVVALNPEHARVLDDAGWDRRRIQQRLCGLSTVSADRIRSLNPAFTPKHESDVEVLTSPDSVVVIVAGAEGLYSAVFPSWSAGAHGNIAVHQQVVSGQACAVPGME